MELAKSIPTSVPVPRDFAYATDTGPKEHKTIERVACADCEEEIPVPRVRNDSYLPLCLRCQQRHYLAQFIPNEM
ncbi:MAG: hypothetical protein A3G80_12825 [Betaproteobacteria bacterium RIFCSPLOWO2_12_FULL_62_13b]|nr:MAG: hypothetical protein A3G80_12825 [Betaproteobacteria bacterium RIFCSPLOWO2_12_FULL_62_13b]